MLLLAAGLGEVALVCGAGGLDHLGRFKRTKRHLLFDALPTHNYGKVLKAPLRYHLTAHSW